MDATVLYQVLLEGGAELIAELISGQVSNVHLQAWTRGKECEIEREFLAAAPGTDISRWLYNGVGDREHPGDLGYWVGYRIASEHYARAPDRQQAIAELIRLGPDDAQRYLETSGWKPDLSREAVILASFGRSLSNDTGQGQVKVTRIVPGLQSGSIANDACIKLASPR